MENKPQRRTIGKNIRYLRLLRGFTPEKLAELADVNEKLISFYETCHGTRKMRKTSPTEKTVPEEKIVK